MPSVRTAIRHLALLPVVLLAAACQSVPESGRDQTPLSFIPDGFQELLRPQRHARTVSWGDFYSSADEPRMITRLRLAEQSALFTAPRDEQEPADLWDRLLSGYQLDIPDNARVENELQSLTQRSEYLEQIQERARPYFHFILEEVEKRDLPAELALLPVVESGFRPFAYSPSHAAGLWQFIPSTARLYGLKQDWWYDGRRDIVASTRAALDHLQELNQRFEGDWELTLAAYNAGAGSVQRAIEKNRRLGKPTDYWSLDLPQETKNYVPRLLALAKLVSESDDFGIELQSIPNEPYFATVTIDSQLDLGTAARLAEIPIEEMHRLNAGFNRQATSPNGPHRLQLPVDKVEVFEERLAALDRDERLNWEHYQVKSGDTLGAIARRYGTSVAALQSANDLKDNRLSIGKQLIIPVSSPPAGTEARLAQHNDAPDKPRNKKGTRLIHRVARGDTLWSLARRYGVASQDLARWNGLQAKDTLHLGQELVVWATGEALAATALTAHPES